MNVLTSRIPQGIMSYIFSIYENQELFQADDNILVGLKDLKAVFPESAFLRTQKALLFYHAKRMLRHCLVHVRDADILSRLRES